MKLKRATTYAVCGFLAGCIIPAAAGYSLVGSGEYPSLLQAHLQSRVLWILDILPFLLALCARQMGESRGGELNKLSQLLAAVAIVPAALLVNVAQLHGSANKLSELQKSAVAVLHRPDNPNSTRILAEVASASGEALAPGSVGPVALDLSQKLARRAQAKRKQAQVEVELGIFGMALILLLSLSLLKKLKAADDKIAHQNRELAATNAQLTAHRDELLRQAEVLVRIGAESKASEQKFHALFQKLPIACFCVDSTGEITEWNEACERLYGIARETSIGKRIDDVYESGVAAVRKDMLANCMQGIANEQRDLHEHINGEDRVIRINLLPMHASDGEIVGAICVNNDITDLKTAETTRQRLAAIVQYSDSAILSTDLDGKITSWNFAAAKMFGYEESEILGHSINKISNFMEFVEIRNKLLSGNSLEGFETKERNRSGQMVEVLLSASLLKSEEDRPIGISYIIRDISERRSYEMQIRKQMLHARQINEQLESQKLVLEETNKRLDELATIDGLTGLKNHRAFQDRLMEEWERAWRYETEFSILMLDVDDFKAYNDKYGHVAGDEVLRQFAERLQHNTRSIDFVARYGGEEFVVLLPNTGAENAMFIAERIRQSICSAQWPNRPITASIGVATPEVDTASPREFIDDADQALYVSKNAGKNRVTHITDVRNCVAG